MHLGVPKGRSQIQIWNIIFSTGYQTLILIKLHRLVLWLPHEGKRVDSRSVVWKKSFVVVRLGLLRIFRHLPCRGAGRGVSSVKCEQL